jgi:hypothetical protein
MVTGFSSNCRAALVRATCGLGKIQLHQCAEALGLLAKTAAIRNRAKCRIEKGLAALLSMDRRRHREGLR